MRLAMCLLLCVGLGGCGDGSGIVPVNGKIILDGKPLADASITFVPQGAGRQATGGTNADGIFTLSTVDPRDGALPGQYKVVITQNVPVEATPEGLSADEAMMVAAKAAASKPKGKNRSPLPVEYTRIDKTPLTQEVPPKTEIVYDLKSK